MVNRWYWRFGRLTILILSLVVLSNCAKNSPIDVSSLEDKVKKILQLHTYELVYRDLSYVAELEKILGLITTVDHRTLFAVNIRVRAGIDFQKGLSIEVLTPDQTGQPRIKVSLPPPSILLIDADEKSIQEYFSVQYGRPIAIQDWEPQIAKAKTRIGADAIRRGVLIKAQENAQRLLKNFFNLTGFPSVEFATKAVTP